MKLIWEVGERYIDEEIKEAAIELLQFYLKKAIFWAERIVKNWKMFFLDEEGNSAAGCIVIASHWLSDDVGMFLRVFWDGRFSAGFLEDENNRRSSVAIVVSVDRYSGGDSVVTREEILMVAKWWEGDVDKFLEVISGFDCIAEMI